MHIIAFFASVKEVQNKINVTVYSIRFLRIFYAFTQIIQNILLCRLIVEMSLAVFNHIIP